MYTQGGGDGCQNTSSAASNTLSPPQPRSNLVQRPLQNTEKKIATSGFLTAAPNSFSAGLYPGPIWEAYSAHPDTLAGLRGPTFKARVR